MHIARPLSRGALAALVLASACAVVPDEIDTGVSIPLTTTSPSGATYRLSNATFNFTGPESTSVTSSGDEPAIEVALSPGSYQLELAPGWRMERIDAGTAHAVDALLVSQAVQQVNVLPGSLSQAYYQFLLTADGQGSVSISFGVTEASTLSGTLNDLVLVGCDEATCPPITAVTQFAFPPLVPERVSAQPQEVWLLGGDAIFTMYGVESGGPQQAGGFSVEMRLRRAIGEPADAPQELAITVTGEIAGTQLDFAFGPVAVVNGVDADGFPVAPTDLAFEAPLVLHQVTASGEAHEFDGTASMTYRVPGACSVDGTGCEDP